MASFETTSFINSIKYLPNSVIVYLDEFHKGYRTSDGTFVDDKYVSYKTIWKPYFKKYINDHFSKGMLVQVKGEMLPYALERNEVVDGYTVIGQFITLASYPRYSAKSEQRMIKECAEAAGGEPDLENFEKPDF